MAAGFVYIIGIKELGWYKIGKTRTPKRRLDRLSVLLPFDIVLVALFSAADHGALEAELHRRFARQRLRGEWFHLSRNAVWELVWKTIPREARVFEDSAYFSDMDWDAVRRGSSPRERDRGPALDESQREARKQESIAGRVARRRAALRCPACGDTWWVDRALGNMVERKSAGKVTPESAVHGSAPS